MNDSTPCRLLRHEPAAGAWNMAVDEMLLDRAQHQAAACLRWYGWNEPTLSLGYFQSYSDRQRHAASSRCAAVRRLTGGGAILHDRELTYSIVLPGGHPLAARRDELYRALHDCLIEALASFGLAARRCDGGEHDRRDREPFLCFQRRSPGDVLLGEHKICGSAQRRRNGAVLQHGSLLLRASPSAAELPGLAELSDRSIRTEEMLNLWQAGLSQRLDFAWEPDELPESEVLQAHELAECRYGSESWTNYRNREYVRLPGQR